MSQRLALRRKATAAAARMLRKATWTKFLLVNPQVVAAVVAGSLTLIGTVAAQVMGRRATYRDTKTALELQSQNLGISSGSSAS
jgi:hypothetical protein